MLSNTWYMIMTSTVNTHTAWPCITNISRHGYSSFTTPGGMQPQQSEWIAFNLHSTTAVHASAPLHNLQWSALENISRSDTGGNDTFLCNECQLCKPFLSVCVCNAVPTLACQRHCVSVAFRQLQKFWYTQTTNWTEFNVHRRQLNSLDQKTWGSNSSAHRSRNSSVFKVQVTQVSYNGL